MKNSAMSNVLDKVRLAIADLSDEELVAAIEDDPLLVDGNLASMVDVRQMVAHELSTRHPRRWEKFVSTSGGINFRETMLTKSGHKPFISLPSFFA